jgi:Fe-S-cluster containining protein
MNTDLPSDERSRTDLASQNRHELQVLYQELDEAVARLGPLCALSGRCCRFKEYGHTLFVSSPEVSLLLDGAPPARALDGGESCPWQDARGRCTAREARPLGCRVYFCGSSFHTHAAELSETFIARLKQLADRHDWPWNYAPLHHHLHQARAEGRLTIELSPGNSTRDEEHHA